MGRLEDIEKRNRKGLALLDVVATGISVATDQPISQATPYEPKIPSQKFSNYLGAGLVVAFLVIVVLVLVF
jgi:ABC-type Na+ efflux pump permease subunit